MKLKNSFFYTLRENASDEDSISSNLLVRAGMIKKSGTGSYMFMPMGYKILKNIENVVREEMNKAGAMELLMPSLIHEDVYAKSGRSETFGSSIFRLKDRYDKPYILGPTHEEMFAIAAKMKVKSYKDLPFNLYQFQNKFRDEPRPRFGLIRVREFIMKDAYSFDTDLAGLDESYEKMFNAYKNIFDRLGIDYKIVKADTGAMGGLLSEEFQAISEIGEDTLVFCEKCDFSSNDEIAECVITNLARKGEEMQMEEVHTPDSKTIEEVSAFLNIEKTQTVKALMYKADDELVACFVQGDRELNEVKLQKILGCSIMEMADDAFIAANSKAVPGFAGPIGIGCKVIIDKHIKDAVNVVVGANKADYHIKNVSIPRDVEYDLCEDITVVKAGDICPVCGGNLIFKKGIEVGNTFKLGTKYSEALDLEYSDENNKLHPVVMGSYGIGIGRTMSAIAEQCSDEKGLVWPSIIAPYKVHIVLIKDNDEEQAAAAEEIYKMLNIEGIEALLDDRKERPGVKFNDAELIGMPVRVTVGKKITEGIVEFNVRKTGEATEVKTDELLETIKETLKKV
ncbi:MAG: proline--tRNA ligase [Clostridia bacterium]|nr:proline--tRNA ligase [Clostridia bacterium]